jgi:Protein of unknown function (DUF3592)
VTDPTPFTPRRTWRTIAGFFAFFFALCTIFVAAVTAVEAWQEHAEAQWPEATARVQTCEIKQAGAGRRNWYHIDCSLSYAVGTDQNTVRVYSQSAPGREVAQYPANQIAPYEDWVAAHPDGTPVVLRYNPENLSKAILATAPMPHGGPHTPDNLKLLMTAAAGFLVLFATTQLLR